ncbi:hypothetical protein J6590_036655 [Homalodisca vitripennis]|nr:hypothetical protein J6590_036655 [Homalodisca vitripennis]
MARGVRNEQPRTVDTGLNNSQYDTTTRLNMWTSVAAGASCMENVFSSGSPVFGVEIGVEVVPDDGYRKTEKGVHVHTLESSIRHTCEGSVNSDHLKTDIAEASNRKDIAQNNFLKPN